MSGEDQKGFSLRPHDSRPSFDLLGFAWLVLAPPSVLVTPFLFPHSLSELEKEVSNLKTGLRAVEMVSTHPCLPECGISLIRL